MAEPEYFKPRVVLQTESYRVIAKSRPPFEGKQRGDEIIIERKRKTAMDEEYWGPVHDLWENRHSMSKDEQLLLDIFQEVATVTDKRNAANKELGDLVKEHAGPKTVTVEQRPVRPTMSKIERRDKLAELLIEVGNTLRGEGVTIQPDMPFDNREGVLGLALTPGVLGSLHKMFPGLPYPLHPVQLVAKLLERSAEELRDATK